MRISVAMCTYNGCRYLEEQLRSIRQQTYLPCELVICDDGSTDGTEQIVERFRSAVPFPVTLHCNPHNLGSTRNFEQAIQLCSGDLIALCDQDDVWSADKLEVMGRILGESPELAGVFSDALLIDQDGTPQPGTLWQRFGFTAERRRSFRRDTAFALLIERDLVTGATLLFRASYVGSLVPFPAEWIHDGWIALLLAGLAEIRPVDATPMAYRLHARQQVGAKTVPLTSHLYTKKQAAREFHLRQAARFRLLLERFETIASAAEGRAGLKAALLGKIERKIGFFETRASLLKRPRLRRLREATRLLPEYRLYEKGLLSFFRDLAH